MRRMMPACLLGLVAVAAAAGCGTTVPLAGRVDAAAPGGLEQSAAGDGVSAPVGQPSLGAVAPAVPESSAVAQPGQPSDAPAAVGLSAAPRVGATGPAVVASRGASRALPSVVARPGARKASTAATASAAPGVKAAPATATPIKVAVFYQTGISGAAAALGINGLSTGDTQAQAAALAADINSHGGINGRQITILDVTSSATDSGTEQQDLCAQATQDSHVDVFVDFTNFDQQLATCLKQAGVVFLDDQTSFGQGTENALGDYWFGPGDLVLERLVRNEVAALAANKWMTKSSKVGIYGYDDNDATNAINTVMKPMLAALGIPVVSVQQISSTNAESGASGVVLNFHAAGVDRILSVDSSPLFVMENAQTQQYFPEYGMLSTDGPGALLEADAPKQQLEGAAGAGYLPYFDIGSGTRPTNWTPNVARCQSIMAAANQTSTESSVLGFQSEQCDAFFFLADAGKAGGGVTAADLAAGAQKLGNWDPVMTFAASYPNGRSDGADGYRYLQFEDNCSCFQYTSGVQPLS